MPFTRIQGGRVQGGRDCVADDAVFARRELPGGGLVLFHFDQSGRLAGASGVGTGNEIARDIKVAEKLIERRINPAPESLADPAVSLESLLKEK